MLAQSNRIRKAREYEKVFAKKGKPFFAPELFIKVCPNNLAESRFGFVVGEKVSKEAVVRNRVKRRLRAIVRKHLADIRGGFDVVIVTRKPSAAAASKKLEQIVGSLLAQANLLV